ncbi:MAG: TrkA family potassium uptake protein [Candidatus Palauibacterales bacterium]|nr:TrkA family potassium uptake protein [Candidatus Palauibacterales bacterium]
MSAPKKHRRILVVGLGHFGWWVARSLHELGHEVVAIDKDEARVDRAVDFVSLGVAGDATMPDLLRKVGVEGAEAAIISTGTDLASAILCVQALKDLGIGEIYVKVTSRRAARAIDAFGVTETVFPEREAAHRLAQRIGTKTVLDYIPLIAGYSIQEIAIPDAWVGHSLDELRLPQEHGIQVVALIDVLTGEVAMVPDPSRPLRESDVAVVLGSDDVVAAMLSKADDDQ